MSNPISAVLFDFSETLFRLECAADWLDGLVDDRESLLTGDAARLPQLIGDPLALRDFPDSLHEAWHNRDLDAGLYRQVYVQALRTCGYTRPGLADKIFTRLQAPVNWRPYPDTKPVLNLLARAGIPVAVVSNIAWDIRSVFDHHAIGDLIQQVVLSYEEGWIKPSPEIFTAACERLDVAADQVLMVGDNAQADGGATAIGARVELVAALPTGERPTALLDAIQRHGLAGNASRYGCP